MCGVVKGFQIACDLAGPLGDLTGRGDQSTRKLVHRDLAGTFGDLTGTGDQPSGKVVLVIRCRTSQRQPERNQSNKRGRGCSQFGQTGIVKIHITLKEISVKLDKRNPTVLRNVFTQAGLEIGSTFFSHEV